MKISGYDSNSISMLFSGIGGKNSGTDILGINYSDYATIKNGSYGKLMKSYYGMDSDKSAKASESDTKSKTSSSTSKDSAKTLANVEAASESLTETAKELYKRSNNKVFAKDTKGNYDTNKIYDKVSDFVEDYNSLVTASEKSQVTSIRNSVSTMKNMTLGNSKALNEIGISVNEKDGTLSINGDTMKGADMEKVKKLFMGTGSYAYGVATQSSMVDSYAEREAQKANTYGSKGNYNYNYNSGSIYSDFF